MSKTNSSKAATVTREVVAPIEVAIVEDDAEIRAGLSQRIEGNSSFRLTGSYGDGESVIRELPKHPPQVVLMDINLPGIDGVECVRQLKASLPDTQFIMLTVYDDGSRIFQSLIAGASGYLLKRTPPEKLFEAIKEVHAGGSPMTPEIARQVVRHFRQLPKPESDFKKLTARETHVLEQLAKGYRYKEIVDNLGISNGTLHSYIRSIYEKLRVHSRTEAVVKFLNR